MKYANIIVNISQKKLDHTYQYAIPAQWEKKAGIGALVQVQFGKGCRRLQGYIISLSDQPAYDLTKIKPIDCVVETGVVVESQLICLASWIRKTYGGTMNDALRTVLPVKEQMKQKERKKFSLRMSEQEYEKQLTCYEKRRCFAKKRVLQKLYQEKEMTYEELVPMIASAETVRAMEAEGVLQVETYQIDRRPIISYATQPKNIILEAEQRAIIGHFQQEYQAGIRRTYVLHGVTGSGKTEVYMEMIGTVLQQQKQVIFLIPEIALTFQTVARFYQKFGEKVAVLHSRLSKGERYDQFERAKNGEVQVIVGPRSAIFAPFARLGLIILDEEHESSYKSEITPKYHAREVAIQRAKQSYASVVLGSATPSVDVYEKAIKGEYHLYQLQHRAGGAKQPEIKIVDLREEFQKKNFSIFSEALRERIEDRLQKKQQVILFLNRRGYAGFVSCRKCGFVIKCPHCDISLTIHQNKKLCCHYCGYSAPLPNTCPSCASRYIAAFGTGTQKVEQLTKKEFPHARVLRMDLDTTGKKGACEQILQTFAKGQADILIGTQMIVKGHDFPQVTLVGILAADLSLFANDYRASERTFQLLTQAAGRAGRGKLPGEVIIQTYQPEQYSIVAASQLDYMKFFQAEISYRKLLHYPPMVFLLVILITAQEEELTQRAGDLLQKDIQKISVEGLEQLGPVKASLAKAKDQYRRVIYLKHEEEQALQDVKQYLESKIEKIQEEVHCKIQFDYQPQTGY